MLRVWSGLFCITALLLSGCARQPAAPVTPVHRPLPHDVVVPAAAAVAPAVPRHPVVPASPPLPATAVMPSPPALALQGGRPLADGSHVPAVQGLLAAAERAVRSGDPDAAAIDLERAQRLAPQSAQVYQRLADVRLRQRRAPEAEQLARKGLAYAIGPVQQAALWRLIAAARQQQGMAQAAQEALARAAALDSPVMP